MGAPPGAGGWWAESPGGVTMQITDERPLVLGSGSPRRREILGRMRIPLRVVAPETSEAIRTGESSDVYLARIVGEKLAAVAAVFDAGNVAGVLVADTIVVLDGEILGKPSSMSDAEQLVLRLVGRTHEVHTRYAIARAEDPDVVSIARTVRSFVTMRVADPDEIRGYARTGEGLDKAGAYAVQGIGAFLVERVEGSYSNVIGLPACEVIVDLKQVGLLGKFP